MHGRKAQGEEQHAQMQGCNTWEVWEDCGLGSRAESRLHLAGTEIKDGSTGLGYEEENKMMLQGSVLPISRWKLSEHV